MSFRNTFVTEFLYGKTADEIAALSEEILEKLGAKDMVVSEKYIAGWFKSAAPGMGQIEADEADISVRVLVCSE